MQQLDRKMYYNTNYFAAAAFCKAIYLGSLSLVHKPSATERYLTSDTTDPARNRKRQRKARRKNFLSYFMFGDGHLILLFKIVCPVCWVCLRRCNPVRQFYFLPMCDEFFRKFGFFFWPKFFKVGAFRFV